MKTVKVFFEPDNIEVEIAQSGKIITAIEKSGMHFELPCGGKGVCGKCRVKVLEGASAANETEKKLLGEKVDEGWRLACQSKVCQPMKISLSKDNPSYHKILSSKICTGRAINPHETKKFFTLPEITLKNPVSLQENLALSLGIDTDKIPFETIKNISAAEGNEFTAVFHNGDILDIEKGDTSKLSYGIGFDLGTTTMVLTLFDLPGCKEIITVVRPNPQIKYGDDVVSRIGYSMEENGLEKLNRCVVEEINKMVEQAVKDSGISADSIYLFNLAGNTVMQQIFLKTPLKSLSKIPFNPAIKGPFTLPAKKLNIKINPRADVFVFPVLGGFVGGDTTGLILSTCIHQSDEIVMGVDIGTNGEIVIGNKHKIISASTAAGPAFEGGRISFGMRAQNGALEKCRFVPETGEFKYHVIGGNSLTGICGSGLIDLVAAMKDAGVLAGSGRMGNGKDERMNKYLSTRNGHEVFVLEPENNKSIYLTQKDVREFQSAKAAIRTGIEILMQIYGTTIDKVERIYLAGALGNFADIESLKKIGLLPETGSEKVKPYGNTALASTLLYLCNKQLLSEIKEIASKTTIIELSLHPKFQDIYTDSLFL